MNRALLVFLVLAATRPCAAQTGDPTVVPRISLCMTSDLAPPVLRGAASVPELWLAQRTIDREWGLSEDSTYKTVDVPGYKSEGWAMMMSATLPGTGQLYVGEGSGWLFLLGEVAGWTGHYFVHHRAVGYADDAANYVGDPTDTLATWSFARYEKVTGKQPTQLEELWQHDRKSYYQALDDNPEAVAGFAGPDPSRNFDQYRGIRQSSQNRFQQVHYLDVALLLNHVVAAVDALRAARAHNVPLQKNVEMQLGGNWRPGDPHFRAALVRRF